MTLLNMISYCFILNFRFTFDVTVERLKDSVLEAKRIRSNSIYNLGGDVADGGLTTDPQKAKMDITAIHLAIIAHQEEVTIIILVALNFDGMRLAQFLCVQRSNFNIILQVT